MFVFFILWLHYSFLYYPINVMIYTDSFQMLDKPYNPGINQTRLHVIFIAIFIYSFNGIFVSMFTHDDIIHLLSLPWLFVTPWTAACQASLSFTVSWSFCKLMSIESMTLSNHTILCCPLFLLPSIFPSIRVFPMSQLFALGGQSTGASSSVIPMSIHTWFPLGLDWFDLLAVPGTLKSPLQHHNLKASILPCSAFLMVQLLHTYMATRKTTALTIWTFVGKGISLLLICCLDLS